MPTDRFFSCKDTGMKMGLYLPHQFWHSYHIQRLPGSAGGFTRGRGRRARESHQVIPSGTALCPDDLRHRPQAFSTVVMETSL